MKNINVYTTRIRWIDSSPKKMRTIIASVKKLNPLQAIEFLKMDNKKPSIQLARAVMSAVHNASIGLKKEKDMLEFHSIRVDQGRSLKRYRPGSRGMAKPIKRETCHITIELKTKI